MTDRDALAALIHDGPIPEKPRFIGAIYGKAEAYRKADAIIAAGWRAPAPPLELVHKPGCVTLRRRYGIFDCACGD